MIFKSILIFVLCFFMIYSFQNTAKSKLYRSQVQSYVGRLHPNEDIMSSLTNLLKNIKHNAVTISSATGSVLHCSIRFANQSSLTKIEGPLQITSLTGTFDRFLKPHIHITVANGKGNCFGGHLPSLQERKKELGQDCPIFTTLEISLNLHKGVVFERKIDPATTFDQLTIRPSFKYLQNLLKTEQDVVIFKQ